MKMEKKKKKGLGIIAKRRMQPVNVLRKVTQLFQPSYAKLH